MKKTLALLILVLSILWVETVSALSYGGSPQFSIPGIYSNTGVELYSSSYGVEASSRSTYPTLDADLGDTRLLSYTFGLRFTSGSLQNSGTLANITFHYGNSWGAGGVTWWGDSSHWVYDLTFKANASPDGKTYIYLTSTRNDYGAYIGAGAYYNTFDLPQFSLPSNATCPGVSSDCILVIQPRFYVKEAWANPGLYIPYIDYTWYYGADKKTQYFRAYFWDLSADWPTPSAWESVLEFFWLHQSWYGLYTGYNTVMTTVGWPYTPNPIWRADVGGMAGVSPIVWTRTNAPANDDTLLRDYFVGNTGSIIETLFPSWVGSTGLQVSTIWADGTISNPGTGTGGTGTGFTACSWITDIGCYFSNAAQSITNGFSSILPSWITSPTAFISGIWNSLLPDINFNGMSDSCATGAGSSSGGGWHSVDLTSWSAYTLWTWDTASFVCGSDTSWVAVDGLSPGAVGWVGSCSPAVVGTEIGFTPGDYLLHRGSASTYTDYPDGWVAVHVVDGTTQGNTSTAGSFMSSSGVTSSIVQKFANLFIILMPVAPVDGSSVCMIDGTVQTIQYDWRTNFFDIMLVLTVFFGTLISLKSVKHD